MKTLLPILLAVCLFSIRIWSQTPPQCNSSDLRYLNLNNTMSGANLVFSVQGHPLVQSQFLNYTLLLDTDPTPGQVTISGPELPQSLPGLPNTGLHGFTARNVCFDESVHTGATWFLDFRQADNHCPAIQNFQLLNLSPGFIEFAWGAAPEADSFRVTYQAGVSPLQIAFTPEPFWEQPLLPAAVHTFGIAAVCNVPGLTQAATVTGPEFIFHIIIVDDIKGIAAPWDSIAPYVCKAYRLQCTQHGDFGTNKEAFIAAHPQLDPFSLAPCPELISSVRIETQPLTLQLYPNPLSGEQLWCSFYLHASTPVWIDIIDFSGRIHDRFQEWLPAGANRIPIAVTLLPPGMYAVRIQSNGGFFSAKFVKH